MPHGSNAGRCGPYTSPPATTPDHATAAVAPADGALPRRRVSPSAARPPSCERATARGRHCPQEAICAHVAAASRRSPSASSCPLACRSLRRLASPGAGLRPGPTPECRPSAHGQSSRQLGEQVDLHHRRGAARRCPLSCTGDGSGAAGRPACILPERGDPLAAAAHKNNPDRRNGVVLTT